MSTVYPWQMSRADYERAVMPKPNHPADVVALLRRLRDGVDAWRAEHPGGWICRLSDVGFTLAEFMVLKKLGLAGGLEIPELTIAGRIELLIADGVNPWIGGPIKTHERVVREAILRGDDVPEDVLRECPGIDEVTR